MSALSLILIKPNINKNIAIAEIHSWIGTNSNSSVLDLKIAKQYADVLNQTEIIFQFYRFIGKAPYDIKDFLNIFYHKFKEKRQYNYFEKLYNGRIDFLLVKSSSEQIKLDEALKYLKGQPAEVDEEGNIIKKGFGIRGKLMNPIRYYTSSQYGNMDEDTYSEVVKKVIDNILHTTDSVNEVKQALQYYLSENQVENIMDDIIDNI